MTSPLVPQIPSSPTLPSSGNIMTFTPTNFKFEEKYAYEKGFSDYFNEKIKPVLKDLDQERLTLQNKLAKNKKMGWLVLMIGLLISAVIFYFSGDLTIPLFLIVPAFGIKYYLATAPGAELARDFKNKILPLVIKFFGDFQYQQFIDVDKKFLSKTGLFDYFNHTKNEDNISGTFGEHQIEFAEITLINNGGKHSNTIFQGEIIMIKLDQPTSGHTIIKREQDKGFWAKLTGHSNGLTNFPIGTPEFEKIYEIYSSSEAEARQQVSPALMERLIALSQKPNLQISFAILEDKMVIAINNLISNNNLFESRASYKLNLDVEEFHQLLSEFNSVLNILDIILNKNSLN